MALGIVALVVELRWPTSIKSPVHKPSSWPKTNGSVT
jgi:hypothetical protein